MRKLEDFWHEYRAAHLTRTSDSFRFQVRAKEPVCERLAGTGGAAEEDRVQYATDNLRDAIEFAKLAGLAAVQIRQTVEIGVISGSGGSIPDQLVAGSGGSFPAGL